MLRDNALVSVSLTAAVCIYAILLLLFPPESHVPLLAAVFFGSNMISRTAFFQRVVRAAARKFAPAAPQVGGNALFRALAPLLQNELVAALRSLRAYNGHARAANDRRRRLFSLMPLRHQKVCAAAGYSAKLSSIDSHIDRNQEYLAAIARTAANTYGITETAATDARNTSLAHYRVVESLGHFARDWSPEGAREVGPLVAYITAQLDRVVPRAQALQTAVILPGSGLGRVAHEVALHAPYAVHAVEFSGLMHACNLQIYAASTTATVHPYLHTCSNFLSADAQVRAVQVESRGRPENLHLALGDFRTFELAHQYKNVVVVSVFFVDTAENVLEYFDAIGRLTLGPGTRNGYWINAGPLKYGTAAQAELSGAEMAHVRRALGWRDLHVLNTIDKRAERPPKQYSHLVPDGVLGYMTDERSLWQGYYGLSMWTSAHEKNKDKVCAEERKR